MNQARIFFVVSFGVMVAAACGGSSTGGTMADGGHSGSSSGSSAGSSGASGGSNPDGGSGGGSEPDAASGSLVAPADGRCGLSPQMLVSAGALPALVDAGPVSIAGVRSLVASPSDLYFTVYAIGSSPPSASGAFSPGSVMRMPLAGGQVAQVLSGYFFGQPLLTANNVLFLAKGTAKNGDAIFSVPLSGASAYTVVTLAANDILVDGVAADGTFVYFGDQRGLEAAPLDPDSGASEFTIVPGVKTNGIGLFGKELIFTQPQVVVDGGGAVESISLPPQANSPVTVLATSSAAPVDLTSCGSKACWLEFGSNSLDEMEPGGGAINKIVLSASFAITNTFVFDGMNFYVIGMDSALAVQTLARVPGDGGSPVILATMHPRNDATVAVDDECVYWSNAVGIFSLAKSAQGPFRQ